MDYDTTQNRRTYLKAVSAAAVAVPASTVAVDNARAMNPRAELKEGIRERLVDFYEDDAAYDCANAYITSAAHAAEDNDLPLTFRYWDAWDNQWVYESLSDYSSAEEFASEMRGKMTATSLIDNTTSQEWDDAEAGDLVLYDLSDRDTDDYTGHTRGIVGRDCNDFDIIQGTLPPELSRLEMTKTELKNDLEGSVDGKARELNWDIIFQNGDSGWDTGGGIEDGCDQEDDDDDDDGGWDDDDGNDDWGDDDDGWGDDDDGWNDDDGSDDDTGNDGDDGDDDTGFSVPGFTLPAVATTLGGTAVYQRMRGDDESE